ncbi:hypothetical protein OF83DRAFT_1067547 [Amylostereum chailletii]|nr:hypothetical protein OF83DRAFT_1067547 [Amylostereum chailletii]
MHLVSLNLPDLLISLWRGEIECEATDSKDDWAWHVLVGETWKELGRIIAAIAPYLPGSFDRPPCNPAEKMSSGYKAWEFLLLVFGLFPALLEGILPMIFWKNFCLLVFGIRLLHQRKITKVELLAAHKVLVTFSEDFEVLYYQRRADRLHFCRPSIHQTPHLAPESTRCGPLGLSSQWPMERTIRNLGQEVKQPSNPYANLSQRGLLRGQVNALKGMMPGIEPEPSTIPRGAIELDDEYILLRAKDTCARDVRPSEAECIRQYVRAEGGECEDTYVPQVTRWARLRLPNGQTARSAWKEKIKPLSRVRMARNVKIQSGGTWEIAEVQFYFRLRLHEDDTVRSLALVSIYDPPNAARLAASHGVVWSSVYCGDASLRVVGAKSIRTVVAMIPYNILQHAAALEHARGSLPDHEYFLMEKPGLDIIFMGGVGEDIVDEE